MRAEHLQEPPRGLLLQKLTNARVDPAGLARHDQMILLIPYIWDMLKTVGLIPSHHRSASR